MYLFLFHQMSSDQVCCCEAMFIYSAGQIYSIVLGFELANKMDVKVNMSSIQQSVIVQTAVQQKAVQQKAKQAKPTVKQKFLNKLGRRQNVKVRAHHTFVSYPADRKPESAFRANSNTKPGSGRVAVSKVASSVFSLFSSHELSQRLHCSPANVERELRERGVPYHKNSGGLLWEICADAC